MAGIAAEGVVERTGATHIHAATAVALSVGVWQVGDLGDGRK